MMDFPPDTILELPSNISATYLSEGAANVVYTINVPPQSSAPEHGGTQEKAEDTAPNPWHGKLLRFRKDLPTTTPTLNAHIAFRTSIAPLFPAEDLIDIRLVSLGSSHLIQTLNAALRAAEQPSSSTPRPKQRHGVYLADDPHALLITDMSPPTSATLIQFKPKWLAPSPSAPPGSKRCRTCALHAKRGIQKPSFCPLDLISSSPDDVRRAAALLLGLPASAATAATASTTTSTVSAAQNGSAVQNSSTTKTATQNGSVANGNQNGAAVATPHQLQTLPRLTHWALTSPLLRHLRHIQTTCDPHGVSSLLSPSTPQPPSPSSLSGLQIAMTLRDVTVFLVVPDGEGVLRARLGDLDVKSLGKVGEWGGVEGVLGGGWYQGSLGNEGEEGGGCWLGRVRERGEGGNGVGGKEGMGLRGGREVKERKKERGGCIGQ
ncbi:hypothetical protein VF21_03888 [Pseudogymnoascus sp. 05NY08]|nr:hypothetical protein VF21_03888 [Pseudogymnoascus sp. 05NY08]